MVASGKRRRKILDGITTLKHSRTRAYEYQLELLGVRTVPEHWTNFGDLPTDVQLMILEMLPATTRIQLECVSQQWRSLLHRSWRMTTSVDIPSTITKAFNLDSITDIHVCGFLSKCGPYLRKIEFYIPGIGIGGHVLHSISRRCRNLEQLHLISDMSGHQLDHLLRANAHFSHFERLHTFNLTYTCADTIHNGMRHLFRMMTRLKTFRLDVGVLPHNITVLFPHCPDLKEYALNIIRVGNIHIGVDPEVIYEFFNYLNAFYPDLETLEVSLCYEDTLDENVIYDHLESIGKTRAIRTFNFGLRTPDMTPNSFWFGDRGLQAFSHFDHLEHISLTAVYLPENFHKYLLPTLKSLRLSVIQNISHHLLVNIAKAVPNINLFHLTYGHSALYNVQIKAHTIVNVLKFCRKLRIMELNLCTFVEKHEVARYLKNHVHDIFSRTSEEAPEDLTINFQYTSRTAEMRQTLRKALGCCGTIDWRTREDVVVRCFRMCRLKVNTRREPRQSPRTWKPA